MSEIINNNNINNNNSNDNINNNNKISEDDGLKFTITSFIRNTILNDKTIRDKFFKYTNLNQPYIPFSVLVEISKLANLNNIYFQDLIKDSAFYYPPKPVVVPHPELLARKQYLEKANKEYEYSKLVKNVAKKEVDENELSSFRSQLSIAVNILVTFFTLLVGGIFVGHKWLNSQLMGLLCGLILGCFGVAVEVWLFVVRASGNQMEKDKEVRTQEKIKEFKIKRRTRQIQKERDQNTLTDGSTSANASNIKIETATD